MASGKMPVVTLCDRREKTRVGAEPVPAADFNDLESQSVLTAAARAVAYELGREAAREYFAERIGAQKV